MPPRSSCSAGAAKPTRGTRARSTPTGSARPSTASTRRRSRPGSSPRRAPTAARRSRRRSARSRARCTAARRAYVKPMLDEVAAMRRPRQRWVDEALASGDRIMGFGHRVYRAEDPRSRILKQTANELGSPQVEVAEQLEQAALAALARSASRARARDQRRVLARRSCSTSPRSRRRSRPRCSPAPGSPAGRRTSSSRSAPGACSVRRPSTSGRPPAPWTSFEHARRGGGPGRRVRRAGRRARALRSCARSGTTSSRRRRARTDFRSGPSPTARSASSGSAQKTELLRRGLEDESPACPRLGAALARAALARPSRRRQRRAAAAARARRPRRERSRAAAGGRCAPERLGAARHDRDPDQPRSRTTSTPASCASSRRRSRRSCAARRRPLSSRPAARVRVGVEVDVSAPRGRRRACTARWCERSAWPSISWTLRRSAPPSSRCVANEWRSRCGCTRPGSSPAFSARRRRIRNAPARVSAPPRAFRNSSGRCRRSRYGRPRDR